MRIKDILALVVLLSLATGVSAQFSLNAAEQSTEMQTAPILHRVPVEVDIVNKAKAKATRKAIWRHRNLVDTKVTFTGSLTQYNDAWSSNGGQNTVSGLILAYYYHTYERNRHTSLFKFDAQYGMNYLDDVWFKNQDFLKLYYLSSWKVKKEGAWRNWAYSFSASFSTQFTKGYESRTAQEQVWSNFMSPGMLNGGLGLTYTSPNAKLPFSVTIEPISGNVLFVSDDQIHWERRQKLGIPVTIDDNGLMTYKKYKAEGGSNVKVSFNRTFTFGKKKGVSLQYKTDLSSFYGWITQAAKHQTDSETRAILPTADWSNSIFLSPVKFLTFQFTTRTVYDRSQLDQVQMQYFLGIGLSYSFKNK